MVKVHFLNVGHGDCTIIEHASGRVTMVDINNGDDIDTETAKEIAKVTPSRLDDWRLPLAKVLNESRKEYGTRSLWRYIQSHPHLDHMRGLLALRENGIIIYNLWDTNHQFVPELNTAADEADWNEYVAWRSGQRGGTILRLNRGDEGRFYNEDPDAPGTDGDGLYILAPNPTVTHEVNAAKKPNANNLSYVLMLVHRGFKVILGGDAEGKVWQDILDTCGSKVLSCNVLKASHHGRDSGYHQKAVEAMSPEYTIVSVGKKPETDASDKYRNYSENVWSTRWKGNITLTIGKDGQGTITSEYDH